MNFGETDCDNNYNFNNMRYALFDIKDNKCYNDFFSRDTVNLISKKVSELTRGVDPKNRKIVVPDKYIYGVMDSIYQDFQPAVGDIYSRYIIPSNNRGNDIQNMINQTIEVIVDYVRNQFAIVQANEKLTVWTTVLGDFNENQLRSHSILKIREKRPMTMMFNMNY